jgi:hypothetical protein
VMLNVIRVQHKKKVEEINYQLSNNRDNYGKKFTFKRDEKRLRLGFILFYAIITGIVTYDNF